VDAPLTVSAAEEPEHIEVALLTVNTGVAFTVTVICFDEEHPLLVPVTV
jgi:hypothetical protein